MKELLDHKLTALDQLSVSLRQKAYKADIEYYCKLWKDKTRRNIQERHMNARKAFVSYSLKVYEELRINKKKKAAKMTNNCKLVKHKSKKYVHPTDRFKQRSSLVMGNMKTPSKLKINQIARIATQRNTNVTKTESRGDTKKTSQNQLLVPNKANVT